jgi:CRISPR/Cas system-associated exonuclease Cas4 (RecB family)
MKLSQIEDMIRIQDILDRVQQDLVVLTGVIEQVTVMVTRTLEQSQVYSVELDDDDLSELIEALVEVETELESDMMEEVGRLNTSKKTCI